MSFLFNKKKRMKINEKNENQIRIKEKGLRDVRLLHKYLKMVSNIAIKSYLKIASNIAIKSPCPLDEWAGEKAKWLSSLLFNGILAISQNQRCRQSPGNRCSR